MHGLFRRRDQFVFLIGIVSRQGGLHAAAPVEQKAGGPQTLLSLTSLADASWSQRGFASLASEGFARNPVVYRCVRMIAEAGARVPLVVEEGGRRLTEHPLATLLAQPNPQAAGAELLEGLYAYLQTAPATPICRPAWSMAR